MTTLEFKRIRDEMPDDRDSVVILRNNKFYGTVRLCSDKVEYSLVDEDGTMCGYEGEIPEGYTKVASGAELGDFDKDDLWMYQTDFELAVDR